MRRPTCIAAAAVAAAATLLVATAYLAVAGARREGWIREPITAQPEDLQWEPTSHGPLLVSKRVHLRKGKVPNIFQVAEARIEPGGQVEAHTHEAAAEVFLGSASAPGCQFRLEWTPAAATGRDREPRSRTVTLGPGASVVVPPGVVHAVSNPGESPCAFWAMLTDAVPAPGVDPGAVGSSGHKGHR